MNHGRFYERRLLFGLEFSVISAIQLLIYIEIGWTNSKVRMNTVTCTALLALILQDGVGMGATCLGLPQLSECIAKKAPKPKRAGRGFQTPRVKIWKLKIAREAVNIWSLVQRSCCQFSKL